MVTPPDGRQPRRSPDRTDPPRPPGDLQGGADEARLAPREQARIDEAVVAVGRLGKGPVLVGALVMAAFLIGLVRPWDWLSGGPSADEVPGPRATAAATPAPDGGPDASRPISAGLEPAEAIIAETCGYPSSWRTSSISFWAGARARIWTAAVAVPASGPDDPAIPFHRIASDTVEAIGWCAPVWGPDRPPLSAEATLYRLRDGTAVAVRASRLEPAVPDALGELWVPGPRTFGRRPPWAEGRYVFRLATPSGSYERFLGLEVGAAPRDPATVPGAQPSMSPLPGSDPALPSAGSAPPG